GHTKGTTKGHTKGTTKGHTKGTTKGHTKGTTKGHTKGGQKPTTEPVTDVDYSSEDEEFDYHDRGVAGEDARVERGQRLEGERAFDPFRSELEEAESDRLEEEEEEKERKRRRR
ncbi:MAG: hypothetical protein HOK20_05890, partial [Alphaproteobacteria bacterium]|nr:hypothetical protein [Alphaproteobacteria bacterium]